VKFRVLGPLVVLAGDERVAVRGQQQRLVLAVLLAHCGTVVSADALIEEVWGESTPSTARKAVQSHAAQLRKHINQSDELLVGRDGGYVLDVAPGQLDSQVFEAEAAAARAQLEIDPEAASDRFRRALELWQGSAYEGLADEAPSVRVEAARLEELRLAATETRFRADLVVRDPATLLGEIEALIAVHPLRERLRELLMLALYRAGRQSDALSVYQETRRVLGTEIGVEPSAALQRLEQRILDHDPTLDGRDPLTVVASPGTERRNPYKGLRAFEESDAADFFGRTELVDRLVDRLTGRGESGRFIVLAGPSGSGKSSVIRAGLIPRIRGGSIAGLGDAVIVTMFPGRDPMASLRAVLPDGGIVGPLVLVIDQFEELFTLADADGQREFVAALVEMVADATTETRILVTIRADFLDRPMQQPDLARLLHQGLELVPPLDQHEVRASIVEPAARVGVHLEPDLVAEMVHDVAAHPAALPLLQYALTDLFERSTGDSVTLGEFHAGGGILGALSRRAEDLYRVMDDAEREAVRQLFLRLVTIADGSQHVRRRVSRSELAELPIDQDSLAHVIDRLGDHRLLIFDREPESLDATVEIPHEALLREWPRLRGWIEESRGELVSHQRLAVSTAEWVAADRDDSYTVRGARLLEYEMLAESSVSLTGTELDYVRAGRATADAEVRARSRRRRILLGVLGVATALSLLLAGFAFDQRGQAEEQARSATARELAAAAVASLDADPERSILLALEAIDTTRTVDGTVLREAEEALHQAVQASRLVSVLDAGPGVAFSPDGSVLATTMANGTVALWDATTGELAAEFVASLRAPAGDTSGVWPLVDVAFSSDGTWVAAASALPQRSGYWAATWDVSTGAEVSVAIGHSTNIATASLNPDGSLLATSSLDSTVRLWDVATAEEVGVLDHIEQALSASFSPDGSRLVVASGAKVHVWDVATRTKQLELEGHDAVVMSVGFLPVGDRVVSASLDGTARIWDLDDGATVGILRHQSAVRVAKPDRTGQVIATGAEDGVVRLWDIATGTELLSLAGHTTPVNTLSFNDDGTLLASGAGLDSIGRFGLGLAPDLEARVWDVGVSHRRTPLTVPARDSATVEAEMARSRLRSGRTAGTGTGTSNRLADVALSPDGTQMAVSGPAGQVTLWDTETGREMGTLDGHDLPVTGIAYSPTGQHLATSAADGIKLWDAATGALITNLIDNDLPLRVTSGWYTDVEFSPDGQTIAVSRADRTLTLVDVAAGQIDEVRNLSGIANGIEYSPDGTTIAAGSDRIASLLIALTGDTTQFIHGDLVSCQVVHTNNCVFREFSLV
jgi:WD40 repeat protein/DNA-binding SARP family transcriptional activator/energy-coupling factor transporter ATP-binding protein EcfA2